MNRNDRGWRKLPPPALTESGKFSRLKNVRRFENQISQAAGMKNDERNGNRKICGR